LFPTDDWKIVFVALHLTGIAFKWYQALEGDPFSRSFAAFRHELLTAFDDGDLRSHSVAALRKLKQTGSVLSTPPTLRSIPFILNITTPPCVMCFILA
jgi:hypothetical protein